MKLHFFMIKCVFYRMLFMCVFFYWTFLFCLKYSLSKTLHKEKRVYDFDIFALSRIRVTLRPRTKKNLELKNNPFYKDFTINWNPSNLLWSLNWEKGQLFELHRRAGGYARHLLYFIILRGYWYSIMIILLICIIFS